MLTNVYLKIYRCDKIYPKPAHLQIPSWFRIEEDRDYCCNEYQQFIAKADKNRKHNI